MILSNFYMRIVSLLRLKRMNFVIHNVELHKTDFIIDFHFYDYGIINTIEQFLLPSILNAPMYSNLARSNYFEVKAELEAMNIRSSFVNNESCLKKEDSILKKDQFEYLYVHLDM